MEEQPNPTTTPVAPASMDTLPVLLPSSTSSRESVFIEQFSPPIIEEEQKNLVVESTIPIDDFGSGGEADDEDDGIDMDEVASSSTLHSTNEPNLNEIINLPEQSASWGDLKELLVNSPAHNPWKLSEFKNLMREKVSDVGEHIATDLKHVKDCPEQKPPTVIKPEDGPPQHAIILSPDSEGNKPELPIHPDLLKVVPDKRMQAVLGINKTSFDFEEDPEIFKSQAADVAFKITRDGHRQEHFTGDSATKMCAEFYSTSDVTRVTQMEGVALRHIDRWVARAASGQRCSDRKERIYPETAGMGPWIQELRERGVMRRTSSGVDGREQVGVDKVEKVVSGVEHGSSEGNGGQGEEASPLLSPQDAGKDMEEEECSPFQSPGGAEGQEGHGEQSPLLKSRGGASTEVLHMHFDSSPFEAEFAEKDGLITTFSSSPAISTGETPIGSLFLQSFDPISPNLIGLEMPSDKSISPQSMNNKSILTAENNVLRKDAKAKDVSYNVAKPKEANHAGRNYHQPRVAHRHPPQSQQHPSKCFLSSVKDVNGRLRPQQDISGGKLVRVKYNYTSKRSDEFDLVTGDMYLILAIATDVWAVGSRYEDALDYVSSRPEFQPKPEEKDNLGELDIPLAKGKSSPRARPPPLPMMKFMPLEAMELVHSYEWSFKAYTPTTPTLRLRSTLVVTSIRGLPDRQLLNPPMRSVSRRSDLLYGENRKLVTLAYDRFVAEILQKIIEEAKFSMQRIVEEVKVVEESPVQPSPTASQGWCSSSPTDSAWTYTAASSPTSCSANGGSRITSPTALVQSLGSALQGVALASSPVSPASIGHAHPTNVQAAASTVALQIVPVENTEPPPPGEFDSERIPKLMDTIAEKEGKRKHILKDSWRWATKHKESILRVIKKKDKNANKEKDNGEGNTAKGEGDLVLGMTGNSTTSLCSPEKKKPAPGDHCVGNSPKAKLEAKQSFTATPPTTTRPGKLDVATGLWDYGATTDPGPKVARPSVRDLFTGEKPRSSFSPMLKDTTMSPGSDCCQAREAKCAPPKLTINTKDMIPNKPAPVEQKRVHAPPIHPQVPPAAPTPPSKLLAKEPPPGAGPPSTAVTQRPKLELELSPLIPPMAPALVAPEAVPTCAMEVPRGRERERQNVGPVTDGVADSVITAPTSEWAARGLVDAMLKRARLTGVLSVEVGEDGSPVSVDSVSCYDADDDDGDGEEDPNAAIRAAEEMGVGFLQEVKIDDGECEGIGKENDPPFATGTGTGVAGCGEDMTKGAGETGCGVPEEKVRTGGDGAETAVVVGRGEGLATGGYVGALRQQQATGGFVGEF